MFVSNVLNGVVTRIDLSIPKTGDPTIENLTAHRLRVPHPHRSGGARGWPDRAGFRPPRDILYVASTGDNEIFAIPNAANRTFDGGTGRVVYQDNAHLRGPLGLVSSQRRPDHFQRRRRQSEPEPNQRWSIHAQGSVCGRVLRGPGAGGAFGLAVTTTPLGGSAWPPSTTTRTAWMCGPSERAPGLPKVRSLRQAALTRWTRSSSQPSACRRVPRLALRRSRRKSILRQARSSAGEPAAIDQLLGITQESDVASTFFSRRRMWDLA